MYTFALSSITESQPLFDAYLATLTGVNDDFWEGHILKSKVYRIIFRDETIGLCGVCDNENLTFFHIRHNLLRHAQPALSAALETLNPQYSYAPTNDEPLLSLCMDRHAKIGMQAYFFTYCDDGAAAVRPPEYPRELLAVAAPGDEADILDSEGVAENIALGKYYVMRKNGVFLGQGFFNRLTLAPGAASIGMSVHPDFRRRGVGRSVIMHMAAICRERGVTPYCGCWYYNHSSKATLESAGFVTRTRLLKIWLAGDKN